MGFTRADGSEFRTTNFDSEGPGAIESLSLVFRERVTFDFEICFPWHTFSLGCRIILPWKLLILPIQVAWQVTHGVS